MGTSAVLQSACLPEHQVRRDARSTSCLAAYEFAKLPSAFIGCPGLYDCQVPKPAGAANLRRYLEGCYQDTSPHQGILHLDIWLSGTGMLSLIGRNREPRLEV